MAFPATTYTFANGSTSDATQVNQNFTDLVNGLTDGTKDLNVSAITLAGTFTANGDIVIGSSTADTLTVNASLGSSVAVSANATYSLGASTKGFLKLYLGANSTFTVGLACATLGSSYTFTFPATVGSLGQTIITDGAGATTFRYYDKVVAAQTTTYLATLDEAFIPGTATSGGFTITLPAASTCSGKRYVIKRTDQTLANMLTVAANGAELIDGSNTTKLATQYEALEILCDGTGWNIVNRRIAPDWTAYTPTFTGFGTIASSSAFWRRQGGDILVQAAWTAGNPSGTGATMTLPTGLTMDSTRVADPSIIGFGTTINGSAIFFHPVAATGTSTSIVQIGSPNNTNNQFAAVAGSTISGNGSYFSMKLSVPITNWKV